MKLLVGLNLSPGWVARLALPGFDAAIGECLDVRRELGLALPVEP